MGAGCAADYCEFMAWVCRHLTRRLSRAPSRSHGATPTAGHLGVEWIRFGTTKSRPGCTPPSLARPVSACKYLVGAVSPAIRRAAIFRLRAASASSPMRGANAHGGEAGTKAHRRGAQLLAAASVRARQTSAARSLSEGEGLGTGGIGRVVAERAPCVADGANPPRHPHLRAHRYAVGSAAVSAFSGQSFAFSGLSFADAAGLAATLNGPRSAIPVTLY